MSTPPDVTLKVPPATHELLKRIAAQEDRKLRTIVERALAKYSPKLAAEVLQSKEAA